MPLNSASKARDLSPKFPNGKRPWIENLAVRPNGNLILVAHDKPEIYEMDPRLPDLEPKLLHLFDNGASSPIKISANGITETSKDVYHVIVSSKIPGSLLGLAYDNAIYKIDYTSLKAIVEPVITKVLGVPHFLNGLATVSSTVVLASDTIGGVVYGIDLSTKKAYVEAYIATKAPGRGVNGIRIRDGFLYYNQMITGRFSKIPIDSEGGIATTEHPQHIAQGFGMIGIDDFAFGKSGNEAFLCQGFLNQVLKVDLSKGSVHSIAGGLCSKIKGPTSAQFSTIEGDERTLYVVTRNGQIFALKV